MTMTAKDGGPAFPVPTLNAEMERQDGMSLRDWFAGQALVSIFAYVTDPSVAADKVYSMADAMLEARKAGAAKK
jgi:hypothetical protein